MISNTTSPNRVFDDFDNKPQKPDTTLPWDYWYMLLISADELGFYRQENLQHEITRNNAVCITHEVDEKGEKFLRFTLLPQDFPGKINIAQINEQRDSFAYGLTHRWLPTAGHPVVFTVRFRASENYQVDGSGGAIGSFGMYLWNAPDYKTDPNANIEREDLWATHPDDTFLMGFLWNDERTLQAIPEFLKGMNAVAAVQTQQNYFVTPIRNVEINKWVNARIVWEVDEAGTQTVSHYINDQLLRTFSPSILYPSLTLQIHNDNERFQMGPNGFYAEYPNPTAPQHFELDEVEVKQL